MKKKYLLIIALVVLTVSCSLEVSTSLLNGTTLEEGLSDAFKQIESVENFTQYSNILSSSEGDGTTHKTASIFYLKDDQTASKNISVSFSSSAFENGVWYKNADEYTMKELEIDKNFEIPVSFVAFTSSPSLTFATLTPDEVLALDYKLYETTVITHKSWLSIKQGGSGEWELKDASLDTKGYLLVKNDGEKLIVISFYIIEGNGGNSIYRSNYANLENPHENSIYYIEI